MPARLERKRANIPRAICLHCLVLAFRKPFAHSNEIRSMPRSRPTRSRRSRTASVMAVVKLSPVSSLSCLVRRYASLFLMFMPCGQLTLCLGPHPELLQLIQPHPRSAVTGHASVCRLTNQQPSSYDSSSIACSCRMMQRMCLTTA